MAAGVDANILAALLEHLAALATSPVLEIAYPGVTFPTRGKTKPDNYLAAFFLPNETRTLSIGAGDQQNIGLFQVSVFWKAGQGLIKPLEIANLIILHFDKNTVLYSGGVKVKIYRKPWAAGSIQEDDRVQLPVTIPYQSFNS